MTSQERATALEKDTFDTSLPGTPFIYGHLHPISQVMDQMVAMHQGRLDALKANYDISAATNGTTIITLVPKDKTVREVLASIELRLPPDLSSTREVVMNEPGSGDLTRIVFGKELRNVNFPPGTFDVDKPLELNKVLAAIGAGK